jgi:RimJ/RimL family protein N-acetyltransferase
MATRPATGDPPGYPSDLERVVTLQDGRQVRIRPIRPDDRDRLVSLYDRLSRHTAYQRFFSIMKRLPPDWARLFATVDYRRRLALVAEPVGPGGADVIAVGRYEPTDREDTAEVAFVVQDGWQGLGLGRILLHDVLDAATARGVRRFIAYVLAENSRMLGLLARFTDIQSRTISDGVAEVIFTRRG